MPSKYSTDGISEAQFQPGPFGSQLHASDYVAAGIPCIMPANMKNNRIDLSDITLIPKQKEVSATVLKTVKIALPHSNIVDQFTGTVAPIFKRQDMLEQENQHLAQLRDWLLPMLMNGQVIVA